MRSLKADLIATLFAYQNRLKESNTSCVDDSDCNGCIRDLNSNVTGHSSLRAGFCGRGICVASDTFMHNSYGTAIEAGVGEESAFQLNDTRAAKESNPQYPRWIESYWDANLGLCGFTSDSQTFELSVLLGGIVLNFVCLEFVLAIWKWLLRPKLDNTLAHVDQAVASV